MQKSRQARMSFSCHVRLLLHPPSLLSGGREGCSLKQRRVGRQLWAVAYTGSPVGHQSYASDFQRGVQKRIPLSSTELHKAALLARLSGLCYYPPEQLADRLETEGMKLVTCGGTSFTRWFVADGPLSRKSIGMKESDCTAAAAEEPEVERVILLRGVVWQGKDVNAFRMWQDLMRFWPAPFAPEHTQASDQLFAHAGVADMAGQLYEALRIPVMEAEALQRRCYFGGHSLGGSLALLLAVLFRLRLPLPASLLQCCTFGSPPVLSHGSGRGGSQVLQMLGLREGSIRSFVLENDPVPRALLSVDPTFTALKNSRPGAALLQLRSWLLGPGVPLTPDRFLADNVGEVNLLRWAPDTGHRVIPLEPEEIEDQLRMVADEASTTTFQGIVDHAHGSYSLDLDAAARQLEQQGR